LKQRGVAIAEEKKDVAATEGVIEAYIHHTKRIGALVELNCETDFVARTAEFKELAHDLAMQIAATSPQFLTSEEMPPEQKQTPRQLAFSASLLLKNLTRRYRKLLLKQLLK